MSGNAGLLVFAGVALLAPLGVVADCPSCGGGTQFTNQEIAQILEVHNKYRSMVGSPPLQWNCNLMCQAQKWADTCPSAMVHSGSYTSPISAGENLATGNDIDTAVGMWFSEYGLVPSCRSADGTDHNTLHFTALVWKETRDLGCGICRKTGTEKIWCQYANTAPNRGGAYTRNVPAFQGTSGAFKSGGFDVDKVREMLKNFKAWGLPTGDAVERFDRAAPACPTSAPPPTTSTRAPPPPPPPTPAPGAGAGGGAGAGAGGGAGAGKGAGAGAGGAAGAGGGAGAGGNKGGRGGNNVGKVESMPPQLGVAGGILAASGSGLASASTSFALVMFSALGVASAAGVGAIVYRRLGPAPIAESARDLEPLEAGLTE